jgi:hypothetical protein
VICVELLVSCAHTTKEIKFFEQEQRSRELEEELEIKQNFPRRTTTSITKLIPHVIVISNSEEEMDIRPKPVVEEISQSIPTSRLVEEGEL